MGRLDVDQMLKEVTEDQWREWLAFRRVRPFGEAAEDYRKAFQTAHLLGPHFKKGKTPKIRDYLAFSLAKGEKPEPIPLAAQVRDTMAILKKRNGRIRKAVNNARR